MTKVNKQAGVVRIIGGHWRGTRLPVADVNGLRPSADRVRETLFNWLLPVLPGARVLDLFAGSGALGLESLSRGAATTTLVERDAGLIANLRSVAARLEGGEAAEIIQADALAWLPRAKAEGRRYDIVFVDPPFTDNLWGAAIDGLQALLADDAWLYIEAPATRDVAMPASWRLYREGGTRDVAYRLWRRGS